jgi:hypothetical protein
MGQGDLNWWERRATVVALSLFAMVPLLWPTFPPLVDLPGHMARYRVMLDGDNSVLRQFYDFHWALIGNLGVDLLIIPVAKIFGLELGVKLIVMTIPALTVTGMLWIAREVHGRIPPTALFALPLAYSFPFMFGFVNFALSMAFALLAFAYWLRLARLGCFSLRAWLFLVIAPLIWVTHLYGLAVLGLLAFSAETIRQRDLGLSWPASMARSASACLVLAPAILLTPFLHRVDSQAGSVDWFDWSSKLDFIEAILRDRWHAFDVVSLLVLGGLVVFASFNPSLAFAKPLLVGAMILFGAYLILPRVLIGSAYADMRLAPFVLAVAILAIVPKPSVDPRFLNTVAMLGLLFFGIRIAAGTASTTLTSSRQERALAALDHVPVGSRLISFTDQSWAGRMEHLSGMAVVRRRSFSNDQWDAGDTNLLSVVKNDAPDFVADPSQTVQAADARDDKALIVIDQALATFPRHAFDYLWLINPPKYDERLTHGMTMIWHQGNDALFRIDHR